MKKGTVIISLLAFALLLQGCGKKEQLTVIATVNDKEITEQQFNAYLKFKGIPEKDKKRVERELSHYLERIAFADVIEQEAKFDTKELEVEVEEFRKQAIIGRYFEKLLKDKIEEQAVKNYYNANPEKYQASKINVAHILIRTNPKMSENERKALLGKAQEVYSKAIAGEDFAELAAHYSEDKISAKKGGDLGWIKKGAIAPNFSSKAFALQANEISEPFSTAFGFHVVKFLQGPKVIKQPYEKVKGNIQYQLRQQAKTAERKRLLEKAKIEKS